MTTVMIEYDPEADATYVNLRSDETQVARTVQVDGDLVMVDVDAAGAPIGVEILTRPVDITAAMIEKVEVAFPVLSGQLAPALSGAGYCAA